MYYKESDQQASALIAVDKFSRDILKQRLYLQVLKWLLHSSLKKRRNECFIIAERNGSDKLMKNCFITGECEELSLSFIVH